MIGTYPDTRIPTTSPQPSLVHTTRPKWSPASSCVAAPVYSSHQASRCSSLPPTIWCVTFFLHSSSDLEHPHQSTPLNQPTFPTFPAVVRSTLSPSSPPTDLELDLAIYKGTVNNPTTFPPSSKSHGSYYWPFEHLLAASLIPLTTAAFVTSGSPVPLLDGLLGVSLILHSHIGVASLFSVSSRTRADCCDSLMRPWRTTYISASSPPWDPCSCGRCA